MTGKVLLRLLALRRQNETTALNALAARQTACRQAEAEAEKASVAVSRHASASLARKRELGGSLSDRETSLLELVHLQSQIEMLGLDAGWLRQAEKDARDAHRESLQALADARETYLQRRRATAKLELLIEQEAARESRRLAAFAEEEPDAGEVSSFRS